MAAALEQERPSGEARDETRVFQAEGLQLPFSCTCTDGGRGGRQGLFPRRFGWRHRGGREGRVGLEETETTCELTHGESVGKLGVKPKGKRREDCRGLQARGKVSLDVEDGLSVVKGSQGEKGQWWIREG